MEDTQPPSPPHCRHHICHLVIVLALFHITLLVNTTSLGTEPLAEQHIWDLAVLWPLEEPPSAATG